MHVFSCRRGWGVCSALRLGTLLLLAAASRAQADPLPLPTSSPEPLHISGEFVTTFVNQSTGGPGTSPADAAAFLAGYPAAPGTPYDLMSTNPQTPGALGYTQLLLRGDTRLGTLETGMTLGIGWVRGSAYQASYWGEPLLPTLNPHLGARAFPLTIAFPTHAGQDDVSAFRTSLLSGYVQTRDHRTRVNVGWLNLSQTDPFVFTPPGNPTVLPGLAPQIAESIGNGAPIAEGWDPSSSILPLHGIDVQLHPGAFSVELSDVALPADPQTPARARIASAVLERHDTRISAEIAHVDSGGASLTTPNFYGSQATIVPTAQGNLPSSILGGQRTTIVGGRVATRGFGDTGIVAEIGRSVYNADGVKHPIGNAYGGYEHLGVAKTVRRVTVGADGYHFDPTYATMFLPYGAPENQWNLSYAWPGQWLKSTYQLVDNMTVGVNRQGYRVHYALDGGPLELRAAYTNCEQVRPSTYDNAGETGFTDGIFLPQSSVGTRGTVRRYALSAVWHPSVADIAFDFVDNFLHREAPFGHPEDAVAYSAPEMTLTVTRHVPSINGIISGGASWYGMRGDFASGNTTNIALHQSTVFIGAQLGITEHTGTLVELRRYHYAGIPTAPGTGDTQYSGTLFLVEQRVRL